MVTNGNLPQNLQKSQVSHLNRNKCVETYFHQSFLSFNIFYSDEVTKVDTKYFLKKSTVNWLRKIDKAPKGLKIQNKFSCKEHLKIF